MKKLMNVITAVMMVSSIAFASGGYDPYNLGIPSAKTWKDTALEVVKVGGTVIFCVGAIGAVLIGLRNYANNVVYNQELKDYRDFVDTIIDFHESRSHSRGVYQPSFTWNSEHFHLDINPGQTLNTHSWRKK